LRPALSCARRSLVAQAEGVCTCLSYEQAKYTTESVTWRLQIDNIEIAEIVRAAGLFSFSGSWCIMPKESQMPRVRAFADIPLSSE
jgi:hypothetical protein